MHLGKVINGAYVDIKIVMKSSPKILSELITFSKLGELIFFQIFVRIEN